MPINEKNQPQLMTIKGCGRGICGRVARLNYIGEDRFSGDRYSSEAYDGIVCFMIFFIPLIPLEPCHFFNFQYPDNLSFNDKPVSDKVSFSRIRIRWHLKLVLRAYLDSISSVCIFVGFVAAISLTVGRCVALRPDELSVNWILFALAIGSVGVAGRLGLAYTDRRSVNLRRVIGLHPLGFSDPALWHPDEPEAKRVAQSVLEDKDPIEASEQSMQNSDFPSAMFFARLAMFVNPDFQGESLTDQILADSRVKELLNKAVSVPKKKTEKKASTEPAEENPGNRPWI